MANNPIVNAGLKYVNGLVLSCDAVAAPKVVNVAAGAARDSTNVNDIILDAAVAINGAVAGVVNGVDVNALAASSFYAVFVIGDSTRNNAAAALLSLSASAPSLPNGYDMFRRIGWVLTDGSSNVLQFWQNGLDQTRCMMYDVGISELSGGASATYAEVNIATSVPAQDGQVIFNVALTPTAADDAVSLLPYGSVATAGMAVLSGTVAAKIQRAPLMVPYRLKAGVPTVQYKVVGAVTLLTAGYMDYLG